jgi:hypothetical protein
MSRLPAPPRIPSDLALLLQDGAGLPRSDRANRVSAMLREIGELPTEIQTTPKDTDQ